MNVVDRVMRCANCGAELPADETGKERRPCPECGSTARTHEVEMTATVGVTASLEKEVDRGVNGARMAGFTLIFATGVGVGVAVGFAARALFGVLVGAATAVGTALLLAAIYRLRPVRRCSAAHASDHRPVGRQAFGALVGHKAGCVNLG